MSEETQRNASLRDPRRVYRKVEKAFAAVQPISGMSQLTQALWLLPCYLTTSVILRALADPAINIEIIRRGDDGDGVKTLSPSSLEDIEDGEFDRRMDFECFQRFLLVLETMDDDDSGTHQDDDGGGYNGKQHGVLQDPRRPQSGGASPARTKEEQEKSLAVNSLVESVAEFKAKERLMKRLEAEREKAALSSASSPGGEASPTTTGAPSSGFGNPEQSFTSGHYPEFLSDEDDEFDGGGPVTWNDIGHAIEVGFGIPQEIVVASTSPAAHRAMETKLKEEEKERRRAQHNNNLDPLGGFASTTAHNGSNSIGTRVLGVSNMSEGSASQQHGESIFLGDSSSLLGSQDGGRPDSAGSSSITGSSSNPLGLGPEGGREDQTPNNSRNPVEVPEAAKKRLGTARLPSLVFDQGLKPVLTKDVRSLMIGAQRPQAGDANRRDTDGKATTASKAGTEAGRKWQIQRKNPQEDNDDNAGAGFLGDDVEDTDSITSYEVYHDSAAIAQKKRDDNIRRGAEAIGNGKSFWRRSRSLKLGFSGINLLSRSIGLSSSMTASNEQQQLNKNNDPARRMSRGVLLADTPVLSSAENLLLTDVGNEVPIDGGEGEKRHSTNNARGNSPPKQQEQEQQQPLFGGGKKLAVLNPKHTRKIDRGVFGRCYIHDKAPSKEDWNDFLLGQADRERERNSKIARDRLHARLEREKKEGKDQRGRHDPPPRLPELSEGETYSLLPPSSNPHHHHMAGASQSLTMISDERNSRGKLDPGEEAKDTKSNHQSSRASTKTDNNEKIVEDDDEDIRALQRAMALGRSNTSMLHSVELMSEEERIRRKQLWRTGGPKPKQGSLVIEPESLVKRIHFKAERAALIGPNKAPNATATKRSLTATPSGHHSSVVIGGEDLKKAQHGKKSKASRDLKRIDRWGAHRKNADRAKKQFEARRANEKSTFGTALGREDEDGVHYHSQHTFAGRQHQRSMEQNQYLETF